ncbi:thioredoxin family protein [Sphingomonas oleivorans]|uniref:Thioredoxin family protein n=1 Tax=Sphingomonas oleivorans TaxID=1735121 RepID=A0A2T5FXZ2_9SPHN|nr:redoxin domain-containing protein [Sphingomonas oleivorans]PTQ10944.1 thioredoxin family protein [Sphingomonas oleivorans]
MSRLFALVTLSVAIAAPASAQPRIGAPAPAFSGVDSNGRPVKLADYRGRTVVLEWNNPGCPFVQKHYRSGNMQKTQARARQDGAVWLSVNSGASGKQGHMTGAAANGFVKAQKAQPTAYLLDPSGAIGRAYAAKTTPEIYVIDAKGILVYQGAIDDRPTADPADIAGARNHVLAALAEVKAGKQVSVAQTRSYGCSVKYAS